MYQGLYIRQIACLLNIDTENITRYMIAITIIKNRGYLIDIGQNKNIYINIYIFIPVPPNAYITEVFEPTHNIRKSLSKSLHYSNQAIQKNILLVHSNHLVSFLCLQSQYKYMAVVLHQYIAGEGNPYLLSCNRAVFRRLLFPARIQHTGLVFIRKVTQAPFLRVAGFLWGCQ